MFEYTAYKSKNLEHSYTQINTYFKQYRRPTVHLFNILYIFLFVLLGEKWN